MTKTTTKNTTKNTDTITPDLNTIEGIQKAIATCTVATTKTILETLLVSKEREHALQAKLASKTASSRKFDDNEIIVKSVFVALRQYVHSTESNANKAFKAAVQAVSTVKFDKKLQEACFSSSVLHCGKSNLNKAKNVYEALNNYKKAVKQAKILLPLITKETWARWEDAMYTVAKSVVKKRGEMWKEQTETVPAKTAPEK